MAQGVKRETRRGAAMAAPAPNLDVFINCPFDAQYDPFFYAAVFTVVRLGYRARCALEADNAGDSRLLKIIKIIGECRFAMHDISRTELSETTKLPRFNMPLELGLWLGAHHLGGADQCDKSCIVFDVVTDRYGKFISDISGQDIHAHDGKVDQLISELAAWLRQQGAKHVAGGKAILGEYEQFRKILPIICRNQNMTSDELKFADFNIIVTNYIADFIHRPAEPSEATKSDPAPSHDRAASAATIASPPAGNRRPKILP
ncbi:hypothetical protein [Methylobacterium sp. SI9]|uniref:hypothetical protein n=1 Tax=Methylobacterium guangdongense TaxID=3138811 RepID=UPI00313F08A3